MAGISAQVFAVRTDLDSHCNVPLFGDDGCTVFEDTGRRMDVSGYKGGEATDFGIPVRNVICAHDCPFTKKTILCVAKNALQISGIRANLIPPFIMREAGLVVKETPKIHCHEPSIEDHSIYDPRTRVRIHLSLQGVFSGFETRALTQDEINNVTDYDII